MQQTAISTNPSMLPALALGFAAFLTNFDITAVVVALPAVASDLGFGVAGYAWVMDAYSLAFTGCLLISGALADRHGRRRALVWGTIVFAAASLACGLAPDGPTLWAARALQGVGAAFMVTGGIALIAGAYPDPKARARAFAWLGVASGIAMAAGPTGGGLIASWVGWRWIFLINLPACALVAWAVPRLLCEARETHRRPIDLVSVALMTAALGLLIEALLHIRSDTGLAIAGFGFSACLALGFVFRQQRRNEPLLDPDVFAQPVMLGVAALLVAVSVGFWAVLVYLPLFLASAFGWSSETAGLALLTATLPMLFLPPIGGRLVSRLGWRLHFTFALAFVAAGNILIAAALATNGPAPCLPLILVGLVLIGIGAALAHPQLSGAVVALVPADRAGMASAVTIVMRQAGFAIGIALLGAVLNAGTEAVNYFWLFVFAAGASLAGLAAALAFLPSRGDQTKRLEEYSSPHDTDPSRPRTDSDRPATGSLT